MAKIVAWKLKEVEQTAKVLTEYPTIAVVNMENLPTRQLQIIRANLKGRAVIKLTKKRLMQRALEGCANKKAKELVSYMQGVPALLLSNLDAFELFKILKDSQTAAPAKVGQVAPADILVPAGPTPFAPGPIIAELSAAGIKAAIEEGKVVIKQDSLVVKKGEPVPAVAASILTRLGIESMRVGLNLVVALDGSDIFTKEILDIDPAEYVQKLQSAHSNAFKLAIAQCIVTAESVGYLIRQACTQADHLALSQSIPTANTAKALVVRAHTQAQILEKKVKGG